MASKSGRKGEQLWVQFWAVTVSIISVYMPLSYTKDFLDPARLSFYLGMPFTLGDLSTHAVIFVLVPVEWKEHSVMENVSRSFLLSQKAEDSHCLQQSD